ncbi:MAG: hypothetical protein H6555_05895 [Lewinellaceae bacterium]|nr:hypothetical protein [Lewinellaceae bacterium]
MWKLLYFPFLVVWMLGGDNSPIAAPQEKTLLSPEALPLSTVNPGNCATFDDAPAPMEAKRNFVLYRDFLKAEDWDLAYDYWQKVYATSPAADGQRNTVYADGIKFYERFISLSQDSLEKEQYIDKIFALYDQISECYPEGGYVPARKGFDLYYTYPGRATKEEIFALFKQAIDIDGLKTADFVINPFTSLLIDLYFEQKVSLEEAQKYQQLIRDIIAKGLANCNGVACTRWEVVASYAPERLEAFEVVKGFYSCDYYMDKYYPEFLEANGDCDVIREVYSRLKFGGCDEAQEKFRALIEVGNAQCAPEKGPAEIAYNCLRDADYQCAIDGFQKAADEATDAEKKAQFLLLIGKIYYAHLKNFPRARQYALQAAAVRPNWGEPYIMIGRMYASSGPLCGPGRGWDSQIVVWPALDMWVKARSVDPAAAAEANKWISRYAQYMPSKEDIFQRSLKEGERFYVGCWIQENTIIRAAN